MINLSRLRPRLKLRRLVLNRTTAMLFVLLFAVIGTSLLPFTHATTSTTPLGGLNAEPSMRPWRYVGANPDSWWDQCDNNWQSWIPAEVSIAKQTHVTFLRLEFPWALLEPQPGVYDWSRADYIVNQVASAGLQLQPIVVYTPSWSAGTASDPPGSTSDYANFMKALVARYKNSVHYWEMWNEPNLGNYWGGTEQQYVDDILNPGYQAVKSVDPTAKVIIGGPSGGYDSTWADNVYAAGGGNSFDIFAFHEYNGSSDVLTDANEWRSYLDAHGQSNIPIWVGEFGYSNSDPSDPTQSQWIQQVFGASNSLIAVAMWYNIRDDDVYTGCGQYMKSEYYGIVQHDDTTIKQSFYTLQSILANSTPSPTATLSASPATIASGGSSTLAWSSTNATSCTASGGWSGTQATSGTLMVQPTSTTTYTLTCTGSGGSASASTTLSVTSGTSPPGDCNGDGHVTIIDLSMLLSHYGSAYAACDFNSDGIVNVLDLSILLSHYGT